MKLTMVEFMKNFGLFICRHFRLPDFISVTVADNENASSSKRVVVEVINDPIVKPFLGGYFNRLTGESTVIFSFLIIF